MYYVCMCISWILVVFLFLFHRVFSSFAICDTLLRIGQTIFFLDSLLTGKRSGFHVYFCVHRIRMFEKKTEGEGRTVMRKKFHLHFVLFIDREVVERKKGERTDLAYQISLDHYYLYTHGTQNPKTNLWCIFLRNAIKFCYVIIKQKFETNGSKITKTKNLTRPAI